MVVADDDRRQHIQKFCCCGIQSIVTFSCVRTFKQIGWLATVWDLFRLVQRKLPIAATPSPSQSAVLLGSGEVGALISIGNEAEIRTGPEKGDRAGISLPARLTAE